MIIEEIKNIKSTKSELRKFGITMGIILGFFGMLFLWRKRACYSYFFVFSATFLFFGLLLPDLLKLIHKIWMSFSIVMGWVMTRVILCILFYLVISPIGFLMRLSGKDFLNLKFNKDIDSYWIPRKKVKFEKSDYERQF